jgi:uncharacterized RDD family membrane protein YckC
VSTISGSAGWGQRLPQIVAAALGVFLIAGLFTPVTGILAAIAELWIASSRAGQMAPLMAASIASSLAMLGPGAWSLDAHYFGRKRISIPSR